MKLKLDELKTNIMRNVKGGAFYFCYSWNLSRSYCIVSFFKILISALQPFVLLYIPARIIDVLTVRSDLKEVLGSIAGLMALELLLVVANLLISYFSTISAMRCRVNTWMAFDRKWIHMDYENLENSRIRDLGSRLEDQVSVVAFMTTLSALLISVIHVIGYVYIILKLHPLMLLMIAVLIGYAGFVAKIRQKDQYEFQPVKTGFERRIGYLFGCMIKYEYGKEARINHVAPWLRERYETEQNDYMPKLAKYRRRGFARDALSLVMTFAQTLLSYGYCAVAVCIGAISLGQFTLYTGAITAFTTESFGIADKLSALDTMMKYAEEYREFQSISRPRYADAAISMDAKAQHGYEIEFRDVSFRYPNTSHDVLKHIDLTIHPGEKVSLVGYNGAGKSTLIKLLCRLYVPTEGGIFLNGTDIQTIRYDEYREILSIVFQDFALFSLPVYENIVLARAYEEELVMEAIEKSGLADKIRSLPNGLQTQLGRQFDANGVEFSGGEGQKLVCSRAFYRNAPVVVLDEPTASLDPVSENQLYERFGRIMEGKQAIYISHRLSSVHFCDTIVVLVDGEMVEKGTHSELMHRGGIYADMYRKQAGYYTSPKEQDDA